PLAGEEILMPDRGMVEEDSEREQAAQPVDRAYARSDIGWRGVGEPEERRRGKAKKERHGQKIRQRGVKSHLTPEASSRESTISRAARYRDLLAGVWPPGRARRTGAGRAPWRRPARELHVSKRQ